MTLALNPGPPPPPTPPDALDLSALASTALAEATLAEAAQQARISLTLCPFQPALGQSQPAWVLADAAPLRAVLHTLLHLAVQHNHDGGWVRLDWVPRDGLWQVAVHAGGPGLSAEQQARLQARLAVPASEEPEPAEDGADALLPWAQARAGLAAMGGELGVISAPGAGCTFWFTLVAGQAGPASQCQVLYIEDNPVNATLMDAMLANVPGLQLHCAATPLQGLALARELLPDLVLVDIQLPGIDGYEVLARLRADPATQGLTVMAVSANAQPPDVARGLAAGFAAYLTKPLHLPLLLQTLCTALGLPLPEGIPPA